jgi:hypothetical protein
MRSKGGQRGESVLISEGESMCVIMDMCIDGCVASLAIGVGGGAMKVRQEKR